MSIVSTGQLTIVDNNDGTSATLSRETIFVPSNSAGVVITYAGLETTMKVVVGATDDSANWTFYVSAIGTGISYRDSDDGADRTGTGIVNGLLTGTRGLVKIVGATQDASYIEITADRAGYPNPIRRIEVVKTKSGAAGVDAVIGYLTNEATIIPTDAAGNGGVLTAAGGTFKVYEGIVDKTGNVAVTYSVVSSSGVTISIASTGVYTITAMSANSGTALLRAVYGTVTTDKVYSIAKSIAGATGVVGQRGSRTFYVALTGATNTWSDSLATTTATAEGGPVLNDMVVQYNNSMNFSQSKFYQVIATVPTWVLINAVVDGNLLVSGTVGATHIQANTFTADNAVTRGLTVRDTSGNIILSASTNLDYAKVGGTKPPSDATAGAPAGTLVNGVAVATVTAGAANGAEALTAINSSTTGLATKMGSAITNVLSGYGAVKTGNLVIDSTGARSSGYGVAFTQKGIGAYNSAGLATFAIDGTTGDAIFKGDISGASGTFTGSITGATGTFGGNVHGGQFTTGDYTGYGWPASGGVGSYLGPEGLRMGDYLNNRYIKIEKNGNAYFPGMTFVNGVMTINALNVINTANLANNSITAGNSSSGEWSASTSIYVPAGQMMKVTGIFAGRAIGISGDLNGVPFSFIASQTPGSTELPITWVSHISVWGPATVSANVGGYKVTVILQGTMK